jgi:hypothetical protein
MWLANCHFACRRACNTAGFVEYNVAMVEDFLGLGSSLASLMRSQIGFAAHKNRVQTGPNEGTARHAQFIR